MTSEYESIYKCFLKNVTSYDLAKYGEEDARELMDEYIHSVASKPNVRRLFKSISFDDDIKEVEYTFRTPFDDEYDREYFEDLFGLGMAIKWYVPKVDSELYINQMVAGRNEKIYSKQATLSPLLDRLNHLETKFDKVVCSHRYSNFAMNGVV